MSKTLVRIPDKQIKPRLSKLLSEIKEICDEHGIRYYLAYGTLLGAVRHQGFIPWDDDIDIAMPRTDYNKFIELAKQGKLKNILHCHELNKRYKYLFAKYCEIDTLCKEKWTNAGKIGLYIDIFPVDGIADTLEKSVKIYKSLKPYYRMYWLCITPMRMRWLLLLPPFTPLFFMWKVFFNKINRTANSKEFGSTNYACCFSLFCNLRNLYRKELYDGTASFMFEGKAYSSYEKYKEYLTEQYGPNYITPPPLHKRTNHQFKAYEIKQKIKN